jgi:hypothetical protein
MPERTEGLGEYPNPYEIRADLVAEARTAHRAAACGSVVAL